MKNACLLTFLWNSVRKTLPLQKLKDVRTSLVTGRLHVLVYLLLSLVLVYILLPHGRQQLAFDGTELSERVCLAMFACLVVDRVVHAARGETGVSQRVQRLLRACPPCAKALTEILQTDPSSFRKLTGSDKASGETFFDDSQAAGLAKSHEEDGDRDSGGTTT